MAGQHGHAFERVARLGLVRVDRSEDQAVDVVGAEAREALGDVGLGTDQRDGVDHLVGKGLEGAFLVAGLELRLDVIGPDGKDAVEPGQNLIAVSRGIHDFVEFNQFLCDGVVAGYISTPLDDGECEIINVSYNGDELTFGEIERHQIGASAFYATYDHIRKCMHRICVTVDDSNSIIVKDIEGYFDVKVERTVNYSDIAVYNGRLILFSNDGYQHIFDNGSESVVASGNLESLRYVVVYGHIAIYFASEHDVYAERIEAYDMRNGDTFAIGLADDRMARSMLIEIV